VREGRASDPALPLSVTRRGGVIWVWRAPIGVVRIWTARRRPHCCRVSFRIPGPRSHFPWRLRPNNRTLRKSRLLDNLLSAETIPILPIRLLGFKVLPIVPNFYCMTGHWGTQQQDRRHNQQDSLHFTPRCWQSTGLMRFSMAARPWESREPTLNHQGRRSGGVNISCERAKRNGPNKRLPSGCSRTTVFPPVGTHPPVLCPWAGLLGPSGRPIEISVSWPTVMVPAHWDQLNITIVTHPKQENSSKPPV
jgi:hypothetical protein